MVHAHLAAHALRVAGTIAWTDDDDHDPDPVRRVAHHLALPALALVACIWPMLIAGGGNRGGWRRRIRSQIANSIPHDVRHHPRREDWQRRVRRATCAAVTYCAPNARRRAAATHDEAIRVGRNIRGARLEAQLTQQQLGDLIGKAWRRISDYEHGRHLPAADALRELEHALERPAGWFHLEHAEYNGRHDDHQDGAA